MRRRGRPAAALPRASGEAGQSLVEFSLLLPLLCALAALLLGGGQLLAAEIALTQAARAGAVAAAAAVARGDAPLPAAQQAADGEDGSLSCGGAGVPAGCVAVSAATGAQSGIALEMATVYESVQPWWPGLPALTLQATAGAAA